MNDSIQALGWTLVHFCWQGALIGIAYRLIDAASSRARSELRYAIALGSMMCMLIAGATTLAYESSRVSGESASRARAIAMGQPVPECASPDNSPIARIAMVATKFDGGQDRLAGLRGLATRAISMDLLPWIDGVWIAGVLVLSFRMLGGWIVLRRLQRNVETTLPVHVSQAFRRLSRSMGIGRNVKLNVSSRISGPVAIGVLRSTILLPVSVLTHLSAEQIEVVLAHELAHIRRADFFWNMIQTVVETLFFFHPAVWSVGGRVRQLREVCCDDAAV